MDCFAALAMTAGQSCAV